VIDFGEQVPIVVVEQVGTDARALGHPIEPDADVAAIDVIVGDLGINGGMELDAGHLRAGEQSPRMDVVNRVSGDGAEGGAETADDAGLLALVDVVVADKVMPDRVSVPAILEGAIDRAEVSFHRLLVVVHVAVFPSEMPVQTEWLISLFSMIQLCSNARRSARFARPWEAPTGLRLAA